MKTLGAVVFAASLAAGTALAQTTTPANPTADDVKARTDTSANPKGGSEKTDVDHKAIVEPNIPREANGGKPQIPQGEARPGLTASDKDVKPGGLTRD